MKDREQGGGHEDDLARIQEILEAQARRPVEVAAKSADGLVQVTFDQRLRVLSVKVRDVSIPPEKRMAIEKATVEAVNTAMQQVALLASAALMELQAAMSLEAFEALGQRPGAAAASPATWRLSDEGRHAV